MYKAFRKVVKMGKVALGPSPLMAKYPLTYYGVVPFHVVANAEEFCRQNP